MAVGIELKGESYGLLIDEIGEVLKLPAASREPNPVNLDARLARVSGGVHRLDGQAAWSFSTSTACSTSAAVARWRRERQRAEQGSTRAMCKRARPRNEARSCMKTCLVVDDSSVIRKVARRILEGLEFQIVEAEDGEQALEACREQMPDAVLLDWNMPMMDGYDFLRALRRLPGGDRPKVVFCTTENDVAHIARALHAGANEYIMKPFDKEIVEAKFQEVGLI